MRTRHQAWIYILLFAIVGSLVLHFLFAIINHFTAPKVEVEAKTDLVDTDVNSWQYHSVSRQFADEQFTIAFLPFDTGHIRDRFMDFDVVNQTVEYRKKGDNQTSHLWRI